MFKLKIKRIHPDATIPKYAHEGDAGFDLCSVENYLLNPGEKVIIKTGLQIEIPENYFGNIRDRSGLVAKHGIHTLAGIIDSPYRGEIKVAAINLGKESYPITKGDRIAQMIIQKFAYCDFEEAKELSKTSRGTGGLGSTGK